MMAMMARLATTATSNNTSALVVVLRGFLTGAFSVGCLVANAG
jgi:hypothetical protein